MAVPQPNDTRQTYLLAAFQNSPVAVAVTRDGTFIDVNEAFTRLTGWTRDEVVGMVGREFGLVSPDDAIALRAGLYRGDRVRDHEVRLFTRDGAVREVLLGASMVCLDGAPHVIATFVDVTEQRKVEQERRASEERLRLIAETISEVFWITDVNIEHTLYVSPAYERVWGRSCRSSVEQPRSFLDAVHPDDLQRVLHTLTAQKLGQPFDHEYRIVRPDGEIRWIWDRGFPVSLEDGTIQRYVGVAQDVTQRKHREELLRGSLERFELVSRATLDAVWDLNVKTGEAWWSDTWYDKYGLCRDQPPNMEDWASHIHPADHQRVVSSFLRMLGSDTQQWREEYRYRLVDGTYASVIDRAYILRDTDGAALRVSGVMEDVTKYLDLQRQLQQSAKMEALGHLAGGVAHDFNNILTVIHGHASFIGDGDVESAETRASATEIAEAADRGANLTRQLLLFSRRQVMQRTCFDVNDALARMGKMLSRIVGEDIRLEFDLSPTAFFIDADSGMVDQIVLNLTVNARDAMPNGGRLTIATREAVVDDVSMHTGAAPGRYVCVSISDTGAGIPPDVLPHIFEPFFSTKAPDRGTGLGLSTVFGIVKQHYGWIDVKTEVDAGTSFDVWLPSSSPSVAAPQPDDVSASVEGAETVLLVEDEIAVLKFMRVALERKGYRIVVASTAREALDAWRSNLDIRLLVTDLVLPGGMGGRELASTLTEERPALRVLLVSGYSADLSGAEIRQRPGRYFLQKPFSSARFVEAVRACLDSR
jgi:PAS domain S-box-containing protein